MDQEWKNAKTGFGWIELDDNRFEDDIIIHVDNSVSKRKKKLSRHLKSAYGHTPLSEEELDFVHDERPEILYIGTGQSGVLPVTSEAMKILERYETSIDKTPVLLDTILNEKRRYIAILHLTC